MKNYYNTGECPSVDQSTAELFAVYNLFKDCYGEETYYAASSIFIRWLCQENLIGQELTPEIFALWELSKN